MEGATSGSDSAITSTAGLSPPELTTEPLADAGGKKKKKKKKKPRSTATLGGHSVETKDLAPAAATAPTVSVPRDNPTLTSNHQSVLLKHREICGFGKFKNPDVARKSIAHIHRYMDDSLLKKQQFQYDLKTGYTAESKILLANMLCLKTMLHNNTLLFNQLYPGILSRHNPASRLAVTRGSDRGLNEGDRKLKHGQIEQRHWTEVFYREFCQNRLNSYEGHIAAISSFPLNEETSHHYEVFIPETFELLNEQSKLLSDKEDIRNKGYDLRSEMKKTSQNWQTFTSNIEIMEETIKTESIIHENTNWTAVRLLNHAINHFDQIKSKETLIRLTSQNTDCFSNWLRQINPQQLDTSMIPSVVNVCIFLGETDTAEQLLGQFLQNVKDDKLTTEDVFSLMNNCKHSFNMVYNNSDTPKDMTKMIQACKIAAKLQQIVSHANEQKNISNEDQTRLNGMLFVDFGIALSLISMRYQNNSLAIKHALTSLIIEEKREAQKARKNADKLMVIKEKERQQKQQSQWLAQQSKAAALQSPAPATVETGSSQPAPQSTAVADLAGAISAQSRAAEWPETSSDHPGLTEQPAATFMEPETSDFSASTFVGSPTNPLTHSVMTQTETADLSDSATATAPDGENLPPAVIEALTAIDNGQPLRTVMEILAPLIDSPTASQLDKAQAHYARAMAIKAQLRSQVKNIVEHVCSVYNYGQLIRQSGLLEEATGELQLPDIKQLREYTNAIEELSTIQPLYALIENMTESYSKIFDATSGEKNLNPVFVEKINQLKAAIQRLTSNIRLIQEGCKDAQVIYGERGEILKRAQQKAGKDRRKRRIVNEHRDIHKDIQSLKSIDNELNRYLKPLNEKLTSS